MAIGPVTDRAPEPTLPTGDTGEEEFARLRRRARAGRDRAGADADRDARDFADVTDADRIEGAEPVRVDGDQQLLAALQRLAAEG